MKKLLICAVFCAALNTPALETPFIAVPSSAQSVSVLKDSSLYFDLSVSGFGQNWSYFGFRGSHYASGDVMTARNTGKTGGAELTLDVTAEQSAPAGLQLNYELSTTKEVPVTMITVGLNFDPQAFEGGSVTAITEDGKESILHLPLGKEGIGKNLKSMILTDAAGAQTSLEFDPPCDVASDVQGRILLAEGTFAGETDQSIQVTLPEKVTFYADSDKIPADPEFETWYPFEPTTDFADENEIGMQDWLEKPAGKHGRIVCKDDELIYNGKPILLWGLNVTYGGCAPDMAVADRRAEMYAKYGINAVRLHKFADGYGWAGIQSQQSFINLDPAGLDRMDYFISRLKEAGIYVTISPNFGVNPGPDEYKRVPYLEEFGPADNRNRVRTGHASIYLSRELQDIQIEQMVTFLEHKNSHTGMTYAEDPAVAAVELLNEESVLFHNTQGVLQKIPTLRQRTARKFFEWLKNRYKTEEALLEAWGTNSLNSFVNEGFTNESWSAKSIVPAGSPWFYDPDQLDGEQHAKKARLLDTMLFYYELQNEFYQRYVKAIRDTGYEGEILASNWQAGRAFSHYYNLHSDALVGLIDRHNYFGGINGNKIKAESMLTEPGSAILSAGMQQVDNRPFMESEWVHKNPTEWSVEGPALIGAYGLGLQGWDASFVFQNDDTGMFNKEVLKKSWAGVMTPQILGVFPAVSRQVLRNDVKESDIKAVRYVHMPSLHEAKIGFNDRVKQDGDIKTFTSDKVPSQALAAVRCTVEFTDEYRDTPAFDLSAYTTNGGIRSATGELFWKAGSHQPDGYFTIDSPATKAVVGFAEGQKCELGGVTIEPESRFGAIYVSAQDMDKTIGESKALLITAIARSRNTGTVILGDRLLIEKGAAPLLMEPVKAKITLPQKPFKVYLLDHDGRRTKDTLSVNGTTIRIDGARDKTCYYLVTF